MKEAFMGISLGCTYISEYRNCMLDIQKSQLAEVKGKVEVWRGAGVAGSR